jgi:hypothetical protein
VSGDDLDGMLARLGTPAEATPRTSAAEILARAAEYAPPRPGIGGWPLVAVVGVAACLGALVGMAATTLALGYQPAMTNITQPSPTAIAPAARQATVEDADVSIADPASPSLRIASVPAAIDTTFAVVAVVSDDSGGEASRRAQISQSNDAVPPRRATSIQVAVGASSRLGPELTFGIDRRGSARSTWYVGGSASVAATAASPTFIVGARLGASFGITSDVLVETGLSMRASTAIRAARERSLLDAGPEVAIVAGHGDRVHVRLGGAIHLPVAGRGSPDLEVMAGLEFPMGRRGVQVRGRSPL